MEMEILNMNNRELTKSLLKIAKEQLHYEIEEIRFIGGGSFGKVFKATLKDGRTIALKAFRCQGAQSEEAQQLKILSKNTSVRMPEVLFTYHDKNHAFMGMSFIEGSNVLNPMFLLKSKSQKEEFAKAVISGMSEWHSVKGEKYGSLNNPAYTSWCEYYRKEKQEPWLNALSELCKKGKFSQKKLELFLKATEIYNKIPEESDRPVLIHGDLNIMNIMADRKTLKLNGFIDPCGSTWANREYDLFQLRNMWGDSFGLYTEYKAQHRMSEYTDFRVAYYGAMNEAACRLSGGLIMPLWEDLCNIRLEKEIKKL